MVLKYMKRFITFSSTSPSKKKASKKRAPRKPKNLNTTTTTTTTTSTTKKASPRTASGGVRRPRKPFLEWETRIILDGMAANARIKNGKPFATIVKTLNQNGNQERTCSDISNWHRNYMRREGKKDKIGERRKNIVKRLEMEKK